MAKKPFEELNFADDGMFQAVMKNPEVSSELVERLLGVRVKGVKYPKLEKKIPGFAWFCQRKFVKPPAVAGVAITSFYTAMDLC